MEPDIVTVGTGAGVLAALWTLISAFVAWTPTKADDEMLTRVRSLLERLSFLAPRNSPQTLSMPGKLPARPEYYDPVIDGGELDHERQGLP